MKKEMKSIIIAAWLWVLAFIFIVHFAYQLFGPFITISNLRQANAAILSRIMGQGLVDKSSPRHDKPMECNRSHEIYDLCLLSRPTILDPISAALSVIDPTSTTSESFEKIKPYPRKDDKEVMSMIKELTVNTAPSNATCDITHNIPALVFSAGGHTGNFFHDFIDGFIPLFITVNSLFPNQELILVVVNCHNWWLTKYAQLLKKFTGHPIINLSKETVKHCFRSAAVGLISHGPMIVDPNLFPGPNKKTIQDFCAFLASTFSQGLTHSKQVPQGAKKGPLIRGHAALAPQLRKARPRLVLVRRTQSRWILNEEELLKAAEEIGFAVEVFEPRHETPVAQAFRVIHNSHAVVGVHGAGLTNILFLRPGSVVIQVVPIGLHWAAELCFGNVAIQLGMEYTEYKIKIRESSLEARYRKNSVELKDPGAVISGNWSDMGIYLKQDVKLDLVRFRKHLENAREKAKTVMLSETL